MAIKAVIGILIALFGLAVLSGLALIAMNASRGRKVGSGVVFLIIGIVGILILAPLNAGLVLVQPNEVGVVFRQTARGDAALLEPLQPGLSWVVPFVDQVITYDVGQQSVTMAGVGEGEASGRSAVRAISSDGQEINIDVTVIFKVDPTQINEIHRNWRAGYLDSFIVAQARSEVRNAITEYGAEEIYSGGRATLESQIAEALSQKFQAQGFLLTDVLIRDISFSPEFTNAIEQKQIAEQEAQRAARQVEQSRQEAEKARVEAQGRADSAVIAAEGEAESIILRAQAEAEALRLINAILAENPNLIQWQYINQLGEKVRIIIIPSNSPFLFDLETLLNQAGAEPVDVPTPAPEEEQP